MSKKSQILKYFQKKSFLTVKNKLYAESISFLFCWLAENDHLHSDITTKTLITPHLARAQIISHENRIIAGGEEISYLLSKYTRLIFIPQKKDGQNIASGEIVAEIEGPADEILSYERTILNILQRSSGIGARTYKILNQARHINPDIFIAATRKTPWMLLDKKAVAAGGGLTHRLDLSDGILVKDNHLEQIKRQHSLKNKSESIKKALYILISKNKYKSFIEIETSNTKEVSVCLEAIKKLNYAQTLAVMLDNFTPQEARNTIRKMKKDFDTENIIFEASGGINQTNINSWAQSDADILSLGSLTHSSKAANLSLNF